MNRWPACSKLTNGNHCVPAPPPVQSGGSARTVLAGKGSLRRAQNRRALAGSAPFWRPTNATGGSDGNTIELEICSMNLNSKTNERKSVAPRPSSCSYPALPPVERNPFFMLIFQLENAIDPLCRRNQNFVLVMRRRGLKHSAFRLLPSLFHIPKGYQGRSP